MYEAYFGLTAAPFQLNPDPTFYFESRGHHSALSYLKFGVHQGEGFIVVTGDIGAGKTTLVRTLLRDLRAEKIAAAQIVSTQLEAGELLRSVAVAFGIPVKSSHKADLLATIESFLTLVASKQRRALLIVDEAQNLSSEAVEELRMLSNFQLGNRALLQSFLIGQPELRTLLSSPSMDQFRQRVIASCHLGPMDVAEVQAYIEHRLARVGWKQDNPVFDVGVWSVIYQWTGGIPRRINILCNRLLLAAFLHNKTHIDAELVETTARDLRSEIGEVTAPLGAQSGLSIAAEGARGEPSRQAVTSGRMARRAPVLPAGMPGPIFCMVGNRTHYIKLMPVIKGLAGQKELPPALLVQVPERLVGFNFAGTALADHFVLPSADFNLGVESNSHSALAIAEMIKRFEPLVEEYRPSAVLVVGGSDATVASCLVARKHGIPIFHMDAGLRTFERTSSDEMNRILTDQCADVLYASTRHIGQSLAQEGVAAERVQVVGNLLVDALHLLMPAAPQPLEILARIGVPTEKLDYCQGYGLVMTSRATHMDQRAGLSECLHLLRQISHECPLIWPVHPRMKANIEQFGLQHILHEAAVILTPTLGYLELISLLAQATCVFTDSAVIQEEAAALRRVCLPLNAYGNLGKDMAVAGAGWPAITNPAEVVQTVRSLTRTAQRLSPLQEFWDGQTAPRIITHMQHWLRQHGALKEKNLRVGK